DRRQDGLAFGRQSGKGVFKLDAIEHLQLVAVHADAGTTIEARIRIRFSRLVGAGIRSVEYLISVAICRERATIAVGVALLYAGFVAAGVLTIEDAVPIGIRRWAAVRVKVVR